MSAAHRTISTLPNGKVQVFTHIPGVAAVEVREYERRGDMVYMLREGHPPQPMCRGLSTHGRPLRVKDGQTLAETIERALAEQDGEVGPEWAHWLSKRLGWVLMGSLGAATAFAWASGAVSLASMNVLR